MDEVLVEITEIVEEVIVTIIEAAADEVTVTISEALQGERGMSAYAVAIEEGYPGTVTQWLASLHGVDATQVELQNNGTYIQWRLIGGIWSNLIAVADITGHDGYTPVKDVDYFDGADGTEIELQKTVSYIQWRYVGGAWSNLVALADIKGDAGYTPVKGLDYDDGAPGREIEIQKGSTYIQWRYVGDISWTNLIAIADIEGAPGTEVEIQNSGTAIQWRLIGGTWADIVLLSALKGDKGDKGDTEYVGNIDGGEADSIYGGQTIIDGGNA